MSVREPPLHHIGCVLVPRVHGVALLFVGCAGRVFTVCDSFNAECCNLICKGDGGHFHTAVHTKYPRRSECVHKYIAYLVFTVPFRQQTGNLCRGERVKASGSFLSPPYNARQVQPTSLIRDVCLLCFAPKEGAFCSVP